MMIRAFRHVRLAKANLYSADTETTARCGVHCEQQQQIARRFHQRSREDIADLLAYYRDRAMPTRRPPEATSDDESVTRHELIAKSHLKLR